MEAVCFSETLALTYQAIQCHNPEYHNMGTRNLRQQEFISVLTHGMPKVMLEGLTYVTEEWNRSKGPDLNVVVDDAYTYGMESFVYWRAMSWIFNNYHEQSGHKIICSRNAFVFFLWQVSLNLWGYIFENNIGQTFSCHIVRELLITDVLCSHLHFMTLLAYLQQPWTFLYSYISTWTVISKKIQNPWSYY